MTDAMKTRTKSIEEQLAYITEQLAILADLVQLKSTVKTNSDNLTDLTTKLASQHGVLTDILHKITAPDKAPKISTPLLPLPNTPLPLKQPNFHEPSSSHGFAKLPKLEIPLFSGENPRGWLFQIELFFTFHSTPPQGKLLIAGFYMTGAALQWFQWLHSTSQLYSWAQFTEQLLQRFGPSKFINHEAQVYKLRQTSTVDVYLRDKNPWFVAQDAEEDSSGDKYFYTLNDPLTKYHCQIPELLGRRIRGYYHGWVILSDHLDNVMWSIWNPLTSKIIHFPALILKDGDLESIRECCLSAQPDDPSSILLLTRTFKPTFVFIRLKSKRKKFRWIEMSYASQLKRITGEDGFFIHNLTCCNGKVYALNGEGCFNSFIIQLDILVKDKEVLIKLLLLGANPYPWRHVNCTDRAHFLKGYGTESFWILVSFDEFSLDAVYLYKLDLTSLKSEDMVRFKGLDMSSKSWEDSDFTDIEMSMKLWEELLDLKEAIFFVNLGRDNLAYYRPGIAPELGGYIHVHDRMDNILHSYHFKENTVSLSSTPSLVHLSIWECRLEDHGGDMCTVDSKQEENTIEVRSVTDNEIGLDEWNLLNLPFDILEMIIERCVCVEYLNFRATCKHFHLAAPLIQWSNKTSSRRLQTYSSVSPWLMVVDIIQGVITFTDPMLGDNYFMKKHDLLADYRLGFSRFGWLLFFSSNFQCFVFFNPFTSDLRKLPEEPDNIFTNMCFSAPPTSPDCMVVGFSASGERIFIHYVAREPSWRTIRVGVKLSSIYFPTFFGQDLYALDGDGKLIGFKELGEEDDPSTFVEARAPVNCCTSPARYYLMKCDQDLIKVIVGKFGACVEVFKWDISKQEWEKIDSLGNRMIYICDTTCLCIQAKTREMENKIYFPILHSKNRKIVYYSLETCTYETFNGENNEQNLKDFSGTTHHWSPHTWIEPSWS